MRFKEYPFMICHSDLDASVIYIEFLRALKIDLSAAIEIVANRLDFSNNEKHYLVADVSKVREVTPDARKYLQRQDAGMKNIVGAALIASNPVAALIANIFIKTPKNFQAKFFYNKKDAFNWIHTRKQKAVLENN